jgi:hypothetical protein
METWRQLQCDNKNVELSLCFNWAPRHEDVLGEWRYNSTHSWSRHYMEVSGQFHTPAALPPEKEPLVLNV